MHPNTNHLIKKYSSQLKDALFGGVFGLLPGILFAGLVGLIVVLLGLKDLVPMSAIIAYGAACGGYWLGSRLTKEKISSLYFSNKSREEILDELEF